MATATAIVLADALATPVNHTFNPIGLDGKGTFWFVDQSASNAIGFWKISFDISTPPNAQPGESSARRVHRVRIGLHEPVLETVSNSTVSGIAPAPTVAYISRAFVEFVLPERTTLTDRKNIRKMCASLLTDTNVTKLVEELQFLN